MLHSNKIHVAINQILINAMIYFNMVAIPPLTTRERVDPPPHTPYSSPLLIGNKNWNVLIKQDHRSRQRYYLIYYICLNLKRKTFIYC